MKKRLNIETKNKQISLKHFSNFAEKAQFIKGVIEFYKNKVDRALRGRNL